VRWPWSKPESDGLHVSGLPEPPPPRADPTDPADAQSAQRDSSEEHLELEQVAYVGSILEGEMIEGLLRAEAIKCMLRPTGIAAASGRGVAVAGPCEVMVRKMDVQKAREVLAAPPS
jgi:Putative prokaryotic signal transducing protein